MSKLSSATTSGLLVTVAGLITLGAIAFGVPDNESAPSTVALLVVDSTPVVVEATPPAVAGVESSIQRVLESNGNLETFDPNAVSNLDPVIARVLSFYGVTLAIPDTKEPGS